MEKNSLKEDDNSPPLKRLKTEAVENSASMNCGVQEDADQTMAFADEMWPGKEEHDAKESQSTNQELKTTLWLKKPGGLRIHLMSGVTVLSLRKKEIPSPAFIASQLPETYRLEALCLKTVRITITDLVELLSRCPYLRELRLKMRTLHRDVCQIIGDKLTDLTTLALQLCADSGDGPKLVLRGCKRLTTLRLQQIGKMTRSHDIVRELSSSICNLKSSHLAIIGSDQDLMELLSRCPYLRELRLKMDSLHRDVCQIIGDKLSDLMKIALQLCADTGDGLQLVLRGCKRLTSLDLQHGGGATVSYDFVRDLPSSIRSLNALHLSFALSDEEVTLLVSKCPDIENLAINVGCHTFTENTMISLSRLHKLETLRLVLNENAPALALFRLKEIAALKILQLSGIKITNAEMSQIRSSLPGVTVTCFKGKKKSKARSRSKRERSESGGKQETNSKLEIKKIEI